MSARDTIYGLLTAGLPDGVYAYRTPDDLVKAPAVVVGSSAWRPDRMTSLGGVEWTFQLMLLTPRSKATYSVPDLEDLSITVAGLMLAQNAKVVGFDTDGNVTEGGVDYLGGTLEIVYKERN